MNKDDFRRSAGLSTQLAEKWFEPLQAAMKEFSISTSLQQAHFIGQLGHESKGFSRISENLNCSVSGLKIFGNRLTQTQREQLGRKDNAPPLSSGQQRAIANLIYGGRFGNRAPDDAGDTMGAGCCR